MGKKHRTNVKRKRTGQIGPLRTRKKPSQPVRAAKAKPSRSPAIAPLPAGQLRGTAAELGALLASADIPLIFVDRKLALRGFTAAAVDLLEIASDAIGRPLKKIVRKFDDPDLFDDLKEVLTTLQPREAEIISESGRAFVRRALPYQQSAGRAEGVVLTFMDVTRRLLAETALRTSEERHRLILEGVPEYAILILDPQGRFLTWSGGAQTILGYSQEEALGQRLDLIYTAEERRDRTLDQELKLVRARKSLTGGRWHVRKDGGKFWGTGVVSALYDDSGRMYGLVKVLRDNTELKVTEENLQKAKLEAERANTAKDHFLANISHELRTPLSAALLWIKLLRSKRQVDPQQLHEGLEAIEKSAQEQQALIEDLMDSSRIVVGKLRLEMAEVALMPLVQKIVDIARPAAAEKELRLEATLDSAVGIVRADHLRLRQVLGNLLNNAVKFTPAHGSINVHLERRGEMVEIRVTDTGQGISAEFIGRVFDRFTQADNASIRTNGGLGLGLSIARHLVELHGGTIEVRSPGLAKGTTFTVKMPLPALSERPKDAAHAKARAVSLRGLEILVVEDTEDTRRALGAVLNAAGALVVPATDAEQALAAYVKKAPDLILSDIGLGKVSGHELLAQIRERERSHGLPRVPAIALTAYTDEKNRELALKSGFQQVLTKPIEPHQVINALAALRPTP